MRILLGLLIITFIGISCNEQSEHGMDDSRQPNDLIDESSPYLLQHAYNPVDWMPWGEKALNKAKELDRLLVISIGYASCHWCHVMEEESFENDSIAELMNDGFVNIKVDREERPDIDQIYMDAIQLMTGRGGWPLNVIALPDGRPVYAGTYHTKEEWESILIKMSDLYKTKPSDLREYANQLTKGINNYNLIPINPEPAKFNKDMLAESIEKQVPFLDLNLGGSKQAPKFPLPNRLDFMMRYGFQSPDSLAMNFVFKSLDKMAFGGIYDHIGGGFSRYSTDTKWHVPHFEKMLYDNAQLVTTYSKAYALTKKELYRDVVYETLNFVKNELMDESGAFYSSLDADSETIQGDLEEGAFYVWNKEELKDLLGQDFELFSDYYNINDYGLWENSNYILIKSVSTDEFIKKHKLVKLDFLNQLQSWKSLLQDARNKRKKPRLDDKTLTSWNGLMLTGFIDAYKVFNEEEFLRIAVTNAEFIKSNLIKQDGGLFHNYKEGSASINGYLEDYSAVIEGFIALYEVTANEDWLKLALDLSNYAIEHFYDSDKGFFYFTSIDDTKLITRRIDVLDNVIPSSNSMMAQNLFVLSHYYNNTEFRERSEHMLNNILPQMSQSPSSFSNWYLLMADFVGPYYEIAISGNDAKAILSEITSEYLPYSMIGIATEDSELPLMKNRYIEGETFIYVCVDGSCKLPVKQTDTALKLLNKTFESP